MYKTLGGIAAAFMLVAIAAPGTAAAQRQEPGIQKQAVGEEFSSQRRRVRRAAVRRYQAPYSYSYGSYPYLAGYGSAPGGWRVTITRPGLATPLVIKSFGCSETYQCGTVRPGDSVRSMLRCRPRTT